MGGDRGGPSSHTGGVIEDAGRASESRGHRAGSPHRGGSERRPAEDGHRKVYRLQGEGRRPSGGEIS